MGPIRSDLIGKFIRGSSKRDFSSADLGWSGLLLEQHRFAPGERPAGELDGLLLCLWNNQRRERCDHPDASGNFVPKLVPPGTLSLYTEGPLSPVRIPVPVSGLFCVFDETLIGETLEDIRLESNVHSLADGVVLQDKRCFRDRSLQSILEGLGHEARRGGPNGHLYADEYIQLFSERLVLLLTARDRYQWATHKLDELTFQRICDQILSTPAHELSLTTLATESGYSKRHFLRSFRAKTGRTPYQYVLDLRLEKARRLMLKPHLSLIDIALECGFANHAHFTRAFRQRLGVQPSQFRKNL
jgi:AraC family transcriptional regulator